MLNRIMKDESGVLTFEWILLITLLVIGIVGGIAAIRDALIIEAGETAGAIVALDQSYYVNDPVEVAITSSHTATGQPTTNKIDKLRSGDAEGSAFVDNSGYVTINVPTTASENTDKKEVTMKTEWVAK